MKSSLLMSRNDAELLQEAQQGKADAFSELVRRHRPASLKLAKAVLRNREEAEDEVQNAWCKAFQHVGQFQHQCQFSTWLTRIVLNQCFMRLRHLRKYPLLSLDADPRPHSDHHAASWRCHGESGEQLLGRAQTAQLLQQEIQCLPTVLRSVLVLRDLQQLPMPVVAERLSLTIPAAKSRLRRARIELGARLQKHPGL